MKGATANLLQRASHTTFMHNVTFIQPPASQQTRPVQPAAVLTTSSFSAADNVAQVDATCTPAHSTANAAAQSTANAES